MTQQPQPHALTQTYLTATARDRLAEAQVTIDTHLAFSRRGSCGLCDQPEPCERRVAAQALIVRYGRLPRRTPGLTFADVTRWPPAGWFGRPDPRVTGASAEPPS